MARNEGLDLPEPPEIRRRFRTAAYQLIGVGAMLLVVLLGASRMFGAITGLVTAEEGPLRIEVTYPERIRHSWTGTIEARVTNIGTEELQAAVVRFDPGFLEGFSFSSFTPNVDRILAEAYEVELHDIGAGQVRLVLVHLQADGYWGHRGFVEAVTPGYVARTEIRSFIIP
jgi:hypothetical protein